MNTTVQTISIAQLQQITNDLRTSMAEANRNPFRAGVMAALSLLSEHVNLAVQRNSLASSLAERGQVSSHTAPLSPTTSPTPAASTASTATLQSSTVINATELSDIRKRSDAAELARLYDCLGRLRNDYHAIAYKYFDAAYSNIPAPQYSDVTARAQGQYVPPPIDAITHHNTIAAVTEQRDNFATKLYRAQRLLAAFHVHVDPSTGCYQHVGAQLTHNQVDTLVSVNQEQRADNATIKNNSNTTEKTS